MRLSILLVLIFTANTIILSQVKIEDRLFGMVPGKKITKQFSENDTIPKVFYPNQNSSNKALISIDGQMVGSNSSAIIEAENIESLSVEKKVMNFQGREYEGHIIIKTKKNYTPKIISLEQLISKYTDLDDGQYICELDYKIINGEIKDVFVDEKYIMKIDVSQLNNLKAHKDLYFVSVLTRNAYNLEKANTIIIRGTEKSKIGL
ncbi:hypothetical protein [Portibacter lacus]|uniref:Uncharacterized protein n=1 Tax=Portibacter lacus TaxID=1099794 RepID=A0AA37SMR2_9BACT|nr:hypothetical protein [Portibacter lacus]GLR16174.1 hypothetical protein GCM10007940_07890 [Portibacter lacus]